MLLLNERHHHDGVRGLSGGRSHRRGGECSGSSRGGRMRLTLGPPSGLRHAHGGLQQAHDLEERGDALQLELGVTVRQEAGARQKVLKPRRQVGRGTPWNRVR